MEFKPAAVGVPILVDFIISGVEFYRPLRTFPDGRLQDGINPYPNLQYMYVIIPDTSNTCML